MHFNSLFRSSKIAQATPRPSKPNQSARHSKRQTARAGSASTFQAPTCAPPQPHPTAWPMCQMNFGADGVPYIHDTQSAPAASVPIAGLPTSMLMPAGLTGWLKKHEAIHLALLALGVIQGGRVILSAVNWIRGTKAQLHTADPGPQLYTYTRVLDERTGRVARLLVAGGAHRAELQIITPVVRRGKGRVPDVKCFELKPDQPGAVGSRNRTSNSR